MTSARAGWRALSACTCASSSVPQRAQILAARPRALPRSGDPLTPRWYSGKARPDDAQIHDEDAPGPSSRPLSAAASLDSPQLISESPFDLLLTDYTVNDDGHLTPRSSSSEGPTLEDLRQLKPRASEWRNRGKVARVNANSAREQWLYDRSFHVLNKSFTHPQLYQLARQAGTPRVNKNSTKAYMVSDLIRRIYGFRNMAAVVEASEKEEVVHSKTYPVTRTQLFLLLAAGRERLTELSSQTKTQLQPQVRQDEHTDSPTPVLVVSGREENIGEAFEKIFAEFDKSIQSDHIDLQVPPEALDLVAISALARKVCCAVEPVGANEEGPNGSGYTRLQLSALKAFDLASAKAVLSAMQADLYEGDRPLFSLTSGSACQLFGAGADEAAIGITPQQSFFNFMPHPLPTPRSKMVDFAMPTELQLYRLVTAKGPRISRQSLLAGSRGERTQASEMALSDMDLIVESQHPDNSPTWSRLEERLLVDREVLNARNAPAVDQDTMQSAHSVSIGSLLFPSPAAGEVPGADAILANLLAPPVSGTWSLERAFNWLRGTDEPASPDTEAVDLASERRPVWFSSHLPGVAFDAEGTFARPIYHELQKLDPQADLKGWVGPFDAADVSDKREFLRYIYRVEQGPDDEVEPVLRLELDVAETQIAQEIVEEQESAPAASAVAVRHQDIDLDAQWVSEKKSPEPSTDSHTVKHRMSCSYKITSAKLSTRRRADLLVPEQFKDVQLSTTGSATLSEESLTELSQTISPYLDALGVSVTQELQEDKADVDAGSSTKTSRLVSLPAPLVDRHGVRPAPPLKIQLGSAILAFERAERVYEASWPLKLPEERRPMDDYDAAKRSVDGQSALDATNDTTSSATAAPSQQTTSSSSVVRPRLVATTVVSHENTGTHTSTRVEWTQPLDAAQDSGHTWHQRIMDVAPLLPVGTRKGRALWT